MRDFRAILAIVVASAGLGWPAAAVAHNVESSGGNGGSPFSYSCTSKGYLYRFAGGSGKATDWLNPMCVSNDENYDGAWYLGTIGGDGGDGFDLSCGHGYFIVGMRVFVDNNEVVHHLAISCVGRHGQPNRTVEMPVHGGVVAYDHYIACPNGEVATGVYGRSGALVDQIGLKCNPR